MNPVSDLRVDVMDDEIHAASCRRGKWIKAEAGGFAWCCGSLVGL
jgi:hypothetical protein